MVNFPTQIHDCESHSSALLDLFLSSNATMAFPPLGNSDHVVKSKFPLIFHQTQNGMPRFIV